MYYSSYFFFTDFKPFLWKNSVLNTHFTMAECLIKQESVFRPEFANNVLQADIESRESNRLVIPAGVKLRGE